MKRIFKSALLATIPVLTGYLVLGFEFGIILKANGYGISMIERYQNVGKRKPYLIFALTDETYSLVCHDDPAIAEGERKNYYLWVSLLNHIYWITGSVIGAVAYHERLWAGGDRGGSFGDLSADIWK